MRFESSRKRRHVSMDSMWTSYSDMFLGLSVIFLLLYVAASLHQGTQGVYQRIENKQLKEENEDLKQQLKVYNNLKTQYLQSQASTNQQQTYQLLMSHLDLLKNQADQEKVKLEKQAEANGKKEEALNQYQQIIRNIINANLLAKAEIKNRDQLLTKRESTIAGQNKQINGLNVMLDNTKAQIANNQEHIAKLHSKLQKEMANLRWSFHQRRMTLAAFHRKMAALKRGNANRLAQLRQKQNQYEHNLANLSNQLNAASAQLAQAGAQNAQLKGALNQTKGALNATKGELNATRGALAKAEANLQAKRELAQQIQHQFAASGVHAKVDMGTGDVLLSFNGEYFNTGSSTLKPGMTKVLDKAMPAYAKSLFENQKIAKKIQNVEIVGFASPTYRGHYIDPSSLKASDRAAVNYNLDLSYRRARAIFEHMFAKMHFKYKGKLLPLIKVTGRSFLGDKNRRVASYTHGGFCKTTDCAKLRTVIIRFKLKQ